MLLLLFLSIPSLACPVHNFRALLHAVAWVLRDLDGRNNSWETFGYAIFDASGAELRTCTAAHIATFYNNLFAVILVATHFFLDQDVDYTCHNRRVVADLRTFPAVHSRHARLLISCSFGGRISSPGRPPSKSFGVSLSRNSAHT